MISERPIPERRARFALWVSGWLMLGCLDQHEGLAVDVAVMHHSGDNVALPERIVYADGEPRGTVTDQGFGVVVRKAYLNIGSVELVPCHDVERGGADLGEQITRGLRQLWPVSVAHAHGPAGPTVINETHLVDLTRADGWMLPISSFLPPPGAYCRVRIHWEPATPDAWGIDAMPDMLGYTAWVAGEYTVDGVREARSFLVRTRADRWVDIPLVDADGRPQRLALSSRQPRATLVLNLGYGTSCAQLRAAYARGGCRGLLDRVYLPTAVEDEAAVLDNLENNLRAVVCQGACPPVR